MDKPPTESNFKGKPKQGSKSYHSPQEKSGSSDETIPKSILRDAQEKQKKGVKLNLYEARAILNANSVNESVPKPSSSSSYHAPQNSQNEIEKLTKIINQLEQKIEMDSLTPDQEKNYFDQIAKYQKRLDEIQKSSQ